MGRGLARGRVGRVAGTHWAWSARLYVGDGYGEEARRIEGRGQTLLALVAGSY